MQEMAASNVAGRIGVSPRLPVRPAIVAVLSLPALIAYLVPGASSWLEYQRAAIASGELWRLITGHWAHWSMNHLAWDLIAFVLLAWIGWRLAAGRTLLTIVLSASAISVSIWTLLPEMARYRGLSGIDSALFVLVALRVSGLAREDGRRGLPLAIGTLLAGFLGKIALETMTGDTLFADSSSFVPVPLAHLVGGLCGWVAATVGRRSGLDCVLRSGAS